MANSNSNKLREAVNASGYLFQLRVGHEIDKTYPDHYWATALREHPWEDPETGEKGYADLVLANTRHQMLRMVVECKRSRDASWIFPIPDDREDKVVGTRCLYTRRRPGGIERASWMDVETRPDTPEAMFCVRYPKGKGSGPLLEKLSEDLLYAADCVAKEALELDRRRKQGKEQWLFYFPVIITTAQLKVFWFNPGNVSLADGIIKNGDFETVDCVRFRKSLTTRLTPDAKPANLYEASDDKERTVFIINASSLAKVLKAWRLDSKPWVH